MKPQDRMLVSGKKQLMMRWIPSWATTYGTIKKFKPCLVIQGFRQESGIDYFDTYAPVVDLKKDFMSSRPDITFVVGKLSRYTCNPDTQHWQAIQRVLKYLKKSIGYRLTYIGYLLVLDGYTDASWINNTEASSSTNGWVFLLSGAAGKKAEWLKNFLFEVSLWSKPIAPISIRGDSVATLANAYSQMYNGKSRHKDFKHTLKHNKEELTLVELGGHLRIEKSLGMQDSDKPKGNNVVGPYDLSDLYVTPSLENKKYFVTFIDDASRFCYVNLLQTKDEALDKFKVFKTEVELQQGSIIKRFRTNRGGEYMDTLHYQDTIFDENRYYSVSKPSLRVPNKTEDIGGSVIPKEVTKEDDPKTFDKAMKPQDVGFWKEAINDEMDSIMCNNMWVLPDLPLGCKPLGCIWIFKRKVKVDGTIKKFKARLVIQGFRQKSGIDYFDTYAPMVDLKKDFMSSRYTCNPDTQHWQAIQRVLKYLKKSIGYRLTYIGYLLVLDGYTDASWINNTEASSSTNGWVFLLSGAAGKKVEWLKNFLFEVSLWSKPIAPISIRCDSAATLANAYSQMYNGKSRHVGVRHSMIR
nr:hypothetical protein [Tanacetum cinerariifolium]